MRIFPPPQENKELDKLIEKAKEEVKNMTPRQRKKMLKAQAKSWARQDKD